MKIATWNINGVKARLETVLGWLEQSKPDIACFQEIKSVDEAFPRQPFEDLGYNLETHGQKGFNGVAILSKLPFDEVNRGLPGDDEDEQARFVEGVFSVDSGTFRVVSLYLPNGNPVTEDRKYGYKLRWMDRLETFAKDRLDTEEPLILAGDYNVIPMPEDCHDPVAWEGDALYRPESRSKFRALSNLGFQDALRSTEEAAAFTFWDYQRGAWQKNHGIRIDHLMCSPEATDQLTSVDVEQHVRAWEKPSDHVPVAGYFDF
ncbi:MAG: exodeoxyribonuclease III [Pseudomonadota bacterium]